MNDKLYKAVKRQLGDTSYLRDAHDASAGWPGFTYYSDTISFYKRNRADINALVEEWAEEMGQTPIDFIAGFNCLKPVDRATYAEIARALYGRLQSNDTQVPNALAWFALEEAASRYDSEH